MANPLPPPAVPTLREIARRAGVSHTTVSLCLRNHPSIPEATRDRVHRLADSLGYRSNVLVSALMTQVRMKHQNSVPEVIGFLTGGKNADEWKAHSANVGFFEGARRRGQQLGMRVEPFWLGPGGEHARETCRMLVNRAIRGNLLAPFSIAVYDHPLDWSRLICVALGYAFKQYDLHRASHNHFRGALTAYERLVRLGYGRIGLMLDAHDSRRVNHGWLGGYLAAQNAFGGAALRPLLTEGPPGNWPVERWLKRIKPDAVIGFGPQQYLALTKGGHRVPDDFAFAALDIHQASLAGVENVAGIDQNLPVIGATAVEILAGQLYHNEQGLPPRPVLSMIDGHWVDGATAPRAV